MRVGNMQKEASAWEVRRSLLAGLSELPCDRQIHCEQHSRSPGAEGVASQQRKEQRGRSKEHLSRRIAWPVRVSLTCGVV